MCDLREILPAEYNFRGLIDIHDIRLPSPVNTWLFGNCYLIKQAGKVFSKDFDGLLTCNHVRHKRENIAFIPCAWMGREVIFGCKVEDYQVVKSIFQELTYAGLEFVRIMFPYSYKSFIDSLSYTHKER